MCSKVIGKIIKKFIGKYEAVAEGNNYYLYSPNDYSEGDFIICNVFSYGDDEEWENGNEFYLEDANYPLSNMIEWLKQENN